MLNTLKIMQELERAIPDLFVEIADEQLLAKKIFAWLQEHPEAVNELKALKKPYPVPQWEGLLDGTIAVQRQLHPYAVIATDGSQIYPDKHQGVPCYVLNSGTAQFVYTTDDAQVRLHSSPRIVTQQDDTNISEDMVNCRRAELEFEVGLLESKKLMSEHPDKPFTFLCDGSLIFWHLESKSKAIKERFLKRYIGLLDEFYAARVPIAGYISLPKSKELIALLRNCLTHKIGPSAAEGASLHTIVDTDIVGLFLQKDHRTEVFTHNSSLAKEYPEHLRPCFVYLHTDVEIARVEVPRWIAEDSRLFTTVLEIILDQSVKGNGYPIALSESHEQAVIKGHEREFFFRLLRKMNLNRSHKTYISQKSLKKRFVSV